MKAVAAGMNPMDLKRGIDMATSNVVDAIRKMARDVADSEEVAQVGQFLPTVRQRLVSRSQTRCKKSGTRA